jgi:hypothetical protein
VISPHTPKGRKRKKLGLPAVVGLKGVMTQIDTHEPERRGAEVFRLAEVIDVVAQEGATSCDPNRSPSTRRRVSKSCKVSCNGFGSQPHWSRDS